MTTSLEAACGTHSARHSAIHDVGASPDAGLVEKLANHLRVVVEDHRLSVADVLELHDSFGVRHGHTVAYRWRTVTRAHGVFMRLVRSHVRVVNDADVTSTQTTRTRPQTDQSAQQSPLLAGPQRPEMAEVRCCHA